MKLEEKAMLAKLGIGVYEGGKQSKILQEEIEDAKKMSKNAVSVRKRLLATPELRALATIADQGRNIHKLMTSPWNGDGTGILPITLYTEYLKKVRDCRDRFIEAKKVLMDAYDQLVIDDRKRMGTEYDIHDYPLKKTLDHRFYFEIQFTPIPSRDNFIVALQEDEVNRIKEEFDEQYKSRWTEATKASYKKLYDVIQKMYETLSDPEAKFHDTLVTNIAKLVEVLPALNVTGDDTLTELTKLAEEELANIDPQELRDFSDYRKVTADLAGAMMEKIEDIL